MLSCSRQTGLLFDLVAGVEAIERLQEGLVVATTEEKESTASIPEILGHVLIELMNCGDFANTGTLCRILRLHDRASHSFSSSSCR